MIFFQYLKQYLYYSIFNRLLRVSEGALELVDCSEMLPGFKYAPGFTNWKVFDANFNEYKSFDEVPFLFVHPHC